MTVHDHELLTAYFCSLRLTRGTHQQ